MGAFHGARGFQAECVSGEDRAATGGRLAVCRSAHAERRSGLFARRQQLSGIGEKLGERIQAGCAEDFVHGSVGTPWERPCCMRGMSIVGSTEPPLIITP